MNNDFFVQIVRSDGCLGKLFGPATWDEAIAKVKAYVAFNGGPVEGETEEQVVAFIENDGSYDWGDGEGIFIVQSETIDAPFGSEDEDLDMDDWEGNDYLARQLRSKQQHTPTIELENECLNPVETLTLHRKTS